ncbi:MAG: RIP metalloprotease RseP [Phenylobacterium zucineum]|nr:MAG: RIP metalloprotease RseP [Phenylobacterium zucineum]
MTHVLRDVVIYSLPCLALLTLIITVHELGHFLAAKACGVAIDRFSIGFGRALASWRDRSGVEWRIGWIPLGGYVRFAGDENAASVPDQHDLNQLRQDIIRSEGVEAVGRYFHFKPLWQRAFITVAGPMANFLLAIAIFASILMVFGSHVLPAKVAGILPGSAAAAAGFRPGDVIIQADGHPIRSFDELQQIIQIRGGLPTVFAVRRDAQTVSLIATPRWKSVSDPVTGAQKVGQLGIAPAQDLKDFVSVKYSPWSALVVGTRQTWQTLQMSVFGLSRIVTGQISAGQLHGPLGIAQMTGNLVKVSAEAAPNVKSLILFGGGNLLKFAAIISVGIGFMNLLPVPVLDGGHLMFYLFEAVTRRPVSAHIQAAGYRVGLALLLGLMLFATWNDLQQSQVFKFIGGLFL